MKLFVMFILLTLSYPGIAMQQTKPQLIVTVRNADGTYLDQATVQVRMEEEKEWSELKYDPQKYCFYIQEIVGKRGEIQVSLEGYASQQSEFSYEQCPYYHTVILGHEGDHFLQRGLERIPYKPYPQLIGVMVGMDKEIQKNFAAVLEELELEEDSTFLTTDIFLGGNTSYKESGGMIVRKKDGTPFKTEEDEQLGALRNRFAICGPMTYVSTSSFSVLTNRIQVQTKDRIDKNAFDQLLEKNKLKVIREAANDYILQADNSIGEGINNVVHALMQSGLVKHAETIAEGIVVKLNSGRR